MRRMLVVCVLALASVAGAAVAFAGSAEDDYGYGTTTGTTTSGTTTADDGSRAVGTYRAALGSRAEVPKPNAPAGAAGVFTATITERRGMATIRWTLTFRRLSGAAVAAHIHRGAAGVAGPVVVPLCGPCRNGQTGRKVVDEDVVAGFPTGRFYVNVHTAKNAAGEIRGQLRRVRR